MATRGKFWSGMGVRRRKFTRSLRRMRAGCRWWLTICEYDWNQVLMPEWKRLGIPQIGVPGFCALKLAQRLLDPVPAGNCKLQTLRQYYRLPENGAHTALGDVLTVIDLMQQVLRPLAERRGLDTWEKIVGFAGDEWFPSRLPFGKFKGRLYQEAREDAELRSWLEWLAESTNERSSAMGRWYLRQLANGCGLEDAAFLDLQIQEDAGGTSSPPGWWFSSNRRWSFTNGWWRRRGTGWRNWNWNTGSRSRRWIPSGPNSSRRCGRCIRSGTGCGCWCNFARRSSTACWRKARKPPEATAGDYQREAAEKDREYDSTASALEGKRELNAEETARLKQLWKKLVRMFHPDLHEQDPEKRKTYELLTQAINEARDRGDIELLELIAKDPQAFILQTRLGQRFPRRRARADGTAVALRAPSGEDSGDDRDAGRGAGERGVWRCSEAAEQDEAVIERIVAAQREELEQEIEGLKAEAGAAEQEIEELVGSSPF